MGKRGSTSKDAKDGEEGRRRKTGKVTALACLQELVRAAQVWTAHQLA